MWLHILALTKLRQGDVSSSPDQATKEGPSKQTHKSQLGESQGNPPFDLNIKIKININEFAQ